MKSYLKFWAHGHHHGWKKLMLFQNPGNELKEKFCKDLLGLYRILDTTGCNITGKYRICIKEFCLVTYNR
jgi:hypothetical protein